MVRLSDETYEFIKGEVVALFERFDVRCIPISGYELAYKMGIILVPYSSLSENRKAAAMRFSSDGFYMEDIAGNDIIFYNNEVSYERMNMTLLHEIGHCVLDHKGTSKLEEKEAQFFAKYAIAPPPLVNKIHPDCPEEIENVFNLSHEAAVYAYEYYNKWLLYGEKDYTEYELRLLKLFSVA